MKLLALLSLFSLSLFAQTCPSGWHSDGLYCVANSQNSLPIYPKKGGSCPSGWHSDGNYCVANTHGSRPIMEKRGNSCPSGWHSESVYCVRNY